MIYTVVSLRYSYYNRNSLAIMYVCSCHFHSYVYPVNWDACAPQMQALPVGTDNPPGDGTGIPLGGVVMPHGWGVDTCSPT